MFSEHQIKSLPWQATDSCLTNSKWKAGSWNRWRNVNIPASPSRHIVFIRSGRTTSFQVFTFLQHDYSSSSPSSLCICTDLACRTFARIYNQFFSKEELIKQMLMSSVETQSMALLLARLSTVLSTRLCTEHRSTEPDQTCSKYLTSFPSTNTTSQAATPLSSDLRKERLAIQVCWKDKISASRGARIHPELFHCHLFPCCDMGSFNYFPPHS